ncbi:MAG: bacillithiol biosynthesis cysteine-adding enzyme BshC [Pyrinomonadaceae bacterium]
MILRADGIPFGSIPGQSKLFVDYQNDPVSLRKYYPTAVASHTEIAERIPEVLDRYTTDREKLCDALADMNRRLGAGEKTLENIEILRRSDAVAVVTGQQAGLFTGPLYTIYKALSAIKAAECLRGRGFNAVPVFWVATEDHDFEEISKTFVIDRAGELAAIAIEPERCRENLPIGYIKLGDQIRATVDELFDDLLPTEFTPEVQKLFADAWRPGEYLGDAFGRVLAHLTEKYGLISLCPLNRELKRLASPIYVEAIKRSREIVDALLARTEAIVADGYAAQVHIADDYFPLFWQGDDHARNALRRTEDGKVRSKDGLHEFTVEELIQSAADEPWRFSPGVVLRSVVQDHILPTVCYFGGAAEIAYFAQSGEVYRVLGRPVTPIFHRQSFTLVESKHAKMLERYDLDLLDLFKGMDHIVPSVVEEHLNSGLARTFAEVEEQINIQLNRLDRELAEFDPTLADNLARRRRKIIYHIAALRHKFHNAQLRKDSVIRHQLEGLFASLLPDRHLQERSLNVSYFVNRYGPQFIDWIYSAVDLDDKDHRLIYL